MTTRDVTLIWRGSVSDFVTDILADCGPDAARAIVSALSRRLPANAEKPSPQTEELTKEHYAAVVEAEKADSDVFDETTEPLVTIEQDGRGGSARLFCWERGRNCCRFRTHSRR